MHFNKLVETLDSLYMKYKVMETNDGGKLVILQRGARMLGIFPDEEKENLLWIPPELFDLSYARTHFIEGLDWNMGGDRTWLSPEMEYNMGDVNDVWGTYAVQTAFDPGNYQWGSSDVHSVDLSQSITIQAHHSNVSVPLEIRKTFRPISDPLLQLWSSDQTITYSFAGYELEACLNRLNQDSTAPLSLWHLMQLPAGGQVIIPTVGTAEVHHFFGSPDSPRVTVSPSGVRFNIDAEEALKISIKVAYITGRMGYYREENENNATLIIRHFSTKPASEYGDVFPPNLNDSGHCVQCYNDDGKLGAFGEIEYHTPLMNRTRNRHSIHDVNQTYCYTGKIAAIRSIGRVLLGMNFQNEINKF